MPIERTFFCDGPDCLRHVRTTALQPSAAWIFVQETGPGFFHPPDDVKASPSDGDPWTFCSYDCLMRFSAKVPAPELVE